MQVGDFNGPSVSKSSLNLRPDNSRTLRGVRKETEGELVSANDT